MPLSPALTYWLCDCGHDAQHASDVQLAFAPDEAVLRRAADEKRILVTADLDFARIIALGRLAEPGLVIFRGGSYSAAETIQLFQRALNEMQPSDFEKAVVIIDSNRIRRRKLPIP